MKRDKHSSSSVLTMEQYVDFVSGRRRLSLTIDQLNSIIFMHGFFRMHRRHKMDIVRTLEEMRLSSPTRSTLGESISSDASLDLEEVRRDLAGIGWPECNVESLRYLSSNVHSDAPSPVLAIEPPPPLSPRKRKWVPRMRKLTMVGATDLGSTL